MVTPIVAMLSLVLVGCGDDDSEPVIGQPAQEADSSLSTQPTQPGTTRPSTPASASAGPATRESLGLWAYQGSRPPFPPPAGPNQVIVAHGDVDNSGTCSVRVFRQGEPVGGLGEGTFRLLRVTGSPEAIDAAVEDIQKGACGG